MCTSTSRAASLSSSASQPSAARSLALRLSWMRASWIAISNSSDNASASTTIEIGSVPGVAIAANTNRPIIRPRRHFASRS